MVQLAARNERELLRVQLASGSARLGSVAVTRSGLAMTEVWEPGPAFQALAAKQAALAAQKEELENARKVGTWVSAIMGACFRIWWAGHGCGACLLVFCGHSGMLVTLEPVLCHWCFAIGPDF